MGTPLAGRRPLRRFHGGGRGSPLPLRMALSRLCDLGVQSRSAVQPVRYGTDRRRLDATAQRPGSERRRHHGRSEEHTSELQSLAYLVCRLLLEKKKKSTKKIETRKKKKKKKKK